MDTHGTVETPCTHWLVTLRAGTTCSWSWESLSSNISITRVYTTSPGERTSGPHCSNWCNTRRLLIARFVLCPSGSPNWSVTLKRDGESTESPPLTCKTLRDTRVTEEIIGSTGDIRIFYVGLSSVSYRVELYALYTLVCTTQILCSR